MFQYCSNRFQYIFWSLAGLPGFLSSQGNLLIPGKVWEKLGKLDEKSGESQETLDQQITQRV